MVISVSFPFSWAAQPEACGPCSLLGAGFLYRILYPTLWSPNWLNFLCTELYNSSTPTQYLPITGHLNMHFRRLWDGMFDRHRVEITVMQFTGHSLPVHQFVTVSWDFNPVPYCQPSSSTPMEYGLLPSLEWHVWPGRRSIYYTHTHTHTHTHTELTKRRSRRYPATTITDADYADDIAILANTPDQAETLLHSLERAAASIGLHVNVHKTEYMCYNQTGDISTLEGTPLKLVDKFTYLGSSVESTEKDIETRLTKAWTAINRLSIIWKSDLTDKMKRSFFQAAVTSILLYGCTTWTLTKRLEKKLDGNYTRMLRAILNKSWQQHPTRHQLYGHLPPITKTIQVRRTRHAGHCWRSRDELIRDVLLWIPTHGRAKAGRPARTYIQQLCEDTGCCPEDLPRAMNDREEWRERVRDIRAASTIWWWWWWWWYMCVSNH